MEQFLPRVAYLCGPITDQEDTAPERFRLAEEAMSILGFKVMNPLKLDTPGHKLTWLECIIRDLPYLAPCDVIALLPGWHSSCGCRIEVIAGIKLGKRFLVLPGAAVSVDLRVGIQEADAIRSDDDEEIEIPDYIPDLDDEGMDDIPGWDNEKKN